MNPTPLIARGDTVTLHYALHLPDDRLVDTSFEAEPMTFVLGDGQFEPRLEEALIGLPLGERTRILLTPEFAFGTPDPAMIHELPRSEVPDHLALHLNDVVEFGLPNGDAIAGTVRAISEETLTVDFNHPLAGMNLQFIVHILAINGQEAVS
jgi:FKBP-type peptidyl-prolyl cis-trans isomerase SlpA